MPGSATKPEPRAQTFPRAGRRRLLVGLVVLVAILLIYWYAAEHRGGGGCVANSQCGGPTPVCDLASGACVGCLADGDCSGAAATCDTESGVCVGCLSDNNCSPEAPACDGSTQTCVGCTSDSYCGGSTPACDFGANTCVQCMTDGDCGASTPACDSGTHTCVSCLADSYCSDPAAPYCDTGTDTCVACTGAADCAATPQTPHCSPTDQTCVQCVSSADCPNSAPVCDLTWGSPTANQCMVCLGDSDCGGATPVCDTGGSGSCVQCLGDSDCAGSGAPYCDPAAHACVTCLTDAECPAGEICSDDGCVLPGGSCDPSKPQPAECSDGRLCAPDGTCRFPELYYYQPSESGGVTPANAAAAARSVGGVLADPLAISWMSEKYPPTHYSPQWGQKGWTYSHCSPPKWQGARPDDTFVYTQMSLNPCTASDFWGREGEYKGWETTENPEYDGCSAQVGAWFNPYCALATPMPGYTKLMADEAWFGAGDPGAPEGGVVVYGPKPASTFFGDCGTGGTYPCVAPYISPGVATDFSAAPPYKSSPCTSAGTFPQEFAPVPTIYSLWDEDAWVGAPRCGGAANKAACVAAWAGAVARDHAVYAQKARQYCRKPS